VKREETPKFMGVGRQPAAQGGASGPALPAGYLQNGQHPPPLDDATVVAAAAVVPSSATTAAIKAISLAFIVLIGFSFPGAVGPQRHRTACSRLEGQAPEPTS
jgi:hypothetical protein